MNKLDNTVVPRTRPDQSSHECDADHLLSFLSGLDAHDLPSVPQKLDFFVMSPDRGIAVPKCAKHDHTGSGAGQRSPLAAYLEHGTQQRGPVGNQPVDTHVEQTVHGWLIVDSPHVHG